MSKVAIAQTLCLGEMSNEVHCFNCGEIAKGVVQEIFDEVGIELQLNKLLEEHLQLVIEQDDSQSQVLCEICVNKLIELYDLAEHAKQQQTITNQISAAAATTRPDIDKDFVLKCPKIENDSIDSNNEEDLNEPGDNAPNGGEDSEFNYETTAEEAEELNIASTEDDNEENVAIEDDYVETCADVPEEHIAHDGEEEEEQGEEDDNEDEEFISTDGQTENIIDLNVVSNVNAINSLPVETLERENEHQQQQQQQQQSNEEQSSNSEAFMVITNIDAVVHDSQSEDNLSEGEQGMELEFYIDEVQSVADECEIIDVVPDYDLQSNEFDFIDVDAYLDSIIKSRMEEMQFNWLVTCKVCELTFETFQDFYRHLIMIHYEQDIGFTCTVNNCNELLADFKKLAKHIILRHCDLQSVQIYGTCHECDFRFSNFLNYNKHSCCNTVKKRMGSDMTCKKCDIEFPSWRRYIFHLQFHMQKQRPKICFLCYEYFNDINDFFIHVHYSHEQLLACQICDRIFENEEYFKKHTLRHKDEMKYQCPHCTKKYAFKNLLARHLEVAHSSKTPDFKCGPCKKAFLTKQQLCQHLRTHKEKEEAEIFYCTTCGLLSDRKSDLDGHIMDEETSCFEAIIADDFQGQSYVCEFCNKDFKAPIDVKAHRQSAVHEDGLFSCRICAMQFKTFFSVQNHIKTHKCWEDWLEKFPLTRYFVCEAKDCMDTYNNWPSLYTHKKRVHKFVICNGCEKAFNRSDYTSHKSKCQLIWDFKCQFCGKDHPTKMSLSVHVARSHNNSNLTCKECHSSYKSEEKLKEHVAYMHTPIKCQHCTKTIKNRRNYDSHLKNVHLKLHNHVCQHCEKTFLYKSEKEWHERNVHSSTTYRCTECPFETTYEKSMRIHFSTTHKMEYEFRCHLCEREFGRKQTLLNHLKRHERSAQIKCTEGCRATFFNENALASHVWTKHGVLTKGAMEPIKSPNNGKKRKRAATTKTIASPGKRRASSKRIREIDVDSSSNSNSFQDLQIEHLANRIKPAAHFKIVQDSRGQDGNQQAPVKLQALSQAVAIVQTGETGHLDEGQSFSNVEEDDDEEVNPEDFIVEELPTSSSKQLIIIQSTGLSGESSGSEEQEEVIVREEDIIITSNPNEEADNIFLRCMEPLEEEEEERFRVSNLGFVEYLEHH